MVSAWVRFLCVFFSLKSRTPLPHFKDIECTAFHSLCYPWHLVCSQYTVFPFYHCLQNFLRNFGPCCLLVSLYYRCIYLHICKKLKRLYKHKMSASFHGPLPCLFLRRHCCWCMDACLSGGLPLPLGKVLLLFLYCQSSFMLWCFIWSSWLVTACC